MSAWLFTILRNLFRSEYRKRRREVEDADGRHVDSLKSAPQQNTGTGSAFASCPRGGRKTPPLLTTLSPASKRGFFLIKNPERYDEIQQNRWLCSVGGSFVGVSNLAQTISESWRTLTKMGSTEVCKKRAEEAHTRAEQSVYPSEQEAWLRVASEWSKLAQTCDHPINGVMGALKRIYSGRSPQFP